MVGQARELTLRALRLTWAAPCSLVGVALGALLVVCGGRARIARGALEFSVYPSLSHCGRRARSLPYRAITFGHVILAVTAAELGALREHEHVHVRQYERWGVLFFAAYPLASFWQWLTRRDPYWDNPFEVEARRLTGERASRAR